jgi:sortase A
VAGWFRRTLIGTASLTIAMAAITLPLSGSHPVSAHAPGQHAVSSSDQEDPQPPSPVRLVIPSLHINAPIEDVGLDDDGGMGSPSTADSVAWFDQGFRPGDPGNAVIAGHVDWVDHLAIFWFLKNLGPGDEVDVVYDDGSTVAFAVDELDVYDDTNTPLDQIFAASDRPHLNLITCGGTFDRATHNYDHRTVVYTTMMSQ